MGTPSYFWAAASVEVTVMHTLLWRPGPGVRVAVLMRVLIRCAKRLVAPGGAHGRAPRTRGGLRPRLRLQMPADGLDWPARLERREPFGPVTTGSALRGCRRGTPFKLTTTRSASRFFSFSAWLAVLLC